MSDETPAGNGEPTPDASAESAAAPDEAPTVPSTASEPPTAVTPPPEPAPAASTQPASEPVAAPAAPAAAAAPVAAETTATPSSDRGHGVFVPAWVAVVVGVLLIAGLGFLVGWIAAPSDDSSPSAASATQPNTQTAPTLPNGQAIPNLPGNGNGNSGNGNGNGGSTQTPTLSGAYLGVTVDPTTGDGGATIASVADNSPAAKAGLKAGDVVTKVDDTNVTNALDLVRAIRSHDAGDTINVTYTRNGQSSQTKVTLSERPTQSS